MIKIELGSRSFSQNKGVEVFSKKYGIQFGTIQLN